MATGHGGDITFGTTAVSLNIVEIVPPNVQCDDIAKPHLGLTKGDNIPYEPGDLNEGDVLEVICEDDHDTVVGTRVVETITITKPLQTGDASARTRAFSGYINSEQDSAMRTSERALKTLRIKVAGNFTETAAVAS